MQVLKNPNFKFMKLKYYALAFSGIIIVIGLLNMTVGKGVTYGIDFAGGVLVQVKFESPVPIGEIRQALSNSGISGTKIQEVEKGETEFIIRGMLPEEDDQKLEEHEEIGNQIIGILKSQFGNLEVERRESVGPQVGQDLRRKATQATIWALIGMLIYIGVRFRFAYGVSAILTLGHDVLITLGIFSLTNRELNLPVVAALLTIVGYSLNDTIVIFDRVRDNLKLLRKDNFESILNISINQTLSRTIITSGTTLMTVLAMFIFGGEVINDFAFTMMIGVVIGTYSSIYQSCSILYFWKEIFNPKKGMGK